MYYRWSPFPFVRLVGVLILGIVLYDQHWVSWQLHTAVGVVIAFVIIYFLLYQTRYLNGAALLAVLLGSGFCLGLASDPQMRNGHYTAHPLPSSFVCKISSDASIRPNWYRYDAEVLATDRGDSMQQLEGRIYLYVSRDSVHAPYKYGDVLGIQKGYFEISAPSNPSEFDYRRFLERQGVFAQAFIKTGEAVYLSHAPASLVRALAYRLRERGTHLIKRFLSEEREQAIALALLLGVKDYLDTSLKEAYSAAGAMHVLAVSGLHVGIVYLLLKILLSRARKHRAGRYLFAVITLSIIWLYALVTGFSPSVIRAATMFSVVILAEVANRRTNIYNSLGIAAFILILYDPRIIYAVGFQLSFAAVLGIVTIQPALYRMLHFHWKPLDYFWSITCVSLAAQLATFPLTLMYFHQFPSYFLISNLVVIPAAFMVMVIGLVMLFVGAIFVPLGEGLGWVLQGLIYGVNETAIWVHSLPYSFFDWLYLDFWDAILVYGCLMATVVALKKYNYSYLTLALWLGAVFIGWQHLKAFDRLGKRSLVFYDLPHTVAMDMTSGRIGRLFSDTLLMEEIIDFRIDPYRLSQGMNSAKSGLMRFQEAKNVGHIKSSHYLEWEGASIFIAKDSLAVKHLSKVDVLYLAGTGALASAMPEAKWVIVGTEVNKNLMPAIMERFPQGRVHSIAEQGFLRISLNE